MHVIYDGIDHKLKVYSTAGELVYFREAHNDSVADNAWRADAGCPPGEYELQQPESNDINAPSDDANDWVGEGRFFIPITGIPGHDGIGIHGGGTCVTPPDTAALAPFQGWCPTLNCIRVQNADLADLAILVAGKAPVKLTVVQREE